MPCTLADFKVGDEVVLVNDTGLAISVGSTARVYEVTIRYLGVEWMDQIRKPGHGSQMNGHYYPECFEPCKGVSPFHKSVRDWLRENLPCTT